MRISILLFFLVFSNISNSQNSYKTYENALEIIKLSPEFNEFLSDLSQKDKDFNVSEGLYPICVYCEFLTDYVNPCKSSNWLEIWPKEQVKNLEKLGNKKNKKILLRFTNTDNSYFISELSYKSKKENLVFLFQINNDKLTLIKTLVNKI
ncbi:hypothetical protein CLU81_2572 [Flavobacterium sp. 9]|uniref:hypothetical protein n=1 Tax=Flavobacterium sp. 9 TaxID=2035198 RepID=UPI000C186062|nr:hypothetical protein [Flavobacterium sp. 9]PIF32060.1 hypothetical protein CLU81_2572 [Flavobacterium sp. 9]